MTTAAIVLAAGASSRYGGANKLLLPFGDGVVIGRVMHVVRHSGVAPIVVVTGHQREAVTSALTELGEASCEFTHNPRYAEGEMISSIQTGLRHLAGTNADAALVVLGDQPLLPSWVVRRLVDAFVRGCGPLIAPKFGALRGHPVLIARRYWDEALRLPDGTPMRTLLRAHADDVAHLLVNTDAVLRDVDTPELYEEALRNLARHT